jgi:hypothetical protein
MTTRTFESFDIDDVERTFNVQRTFEHPLLDAWLQLSGKEDSINAVNASVYEVLEKYRNKLKLNVDTWNEDELKFHFIAPLISVIDFAIEEKNIHSFTQRTITAVVGDVQLTGRVDFVIATGKSKPIQPFFFLHEYKKERTGETDPKAQLLAEMLAARELNAVKYPLYGCYVVGRNWFFLVLEGSIYAESDAFVATHSDDMLRIYAILCEAKVIIAKLADLFK